MAMFISRSPDETLALGDAWGRQAEAGWLIGLRGELGAGKTLLVKGLARGLGVAVPVRSPTYALVHEYPGGRLPLVHLDFYRLDNPEQIRAAGLEDYLVRPGGVTVVEWIERWLPAAGPRAGGGQSGGLGRGRLRLVQLECLGETERRITYDDTGA